MIGDLPDAPELPDLDAPAPANDAKPPLRIFDKDGTVHYSQLKKLALSGVQYLHTVNTDSEPTRAMLVGTVTHYLVLGARPGAKKLVLFDGDRRSGKAWDAFLDAHPKATHEIVTRPEWAEGEAMAESIRRSPIAQRRLAGAAYEVPLRWEENGIPCSTSGIDIIPVNGDLGDLKSTKSTHPDTFKRQAFQMLYPQQLAFYRRGRLAHGLPVPNLFILGVESKPPYEVVELILTPDLISLADKSLTLWFEDLRRNRLAIPEPRDVYDWPGYAEAPVEWGVPEWRKRDEDENEDEEEEEAAA